MLHKNKEEFVRALEGAAKKKEFLLPLMEKDYYLTLLLSRVHELSEDLVFKGGTCLNKIYYEYYRLSEDLDFSMKLPRYESTRGERRKSIQPVKDNIKKFAQQFDLTIDDVDVAGRNESKQYIYYFVYKSALRPLEGRIKFEVSLRYDPICATEKRKVQHSFFHPFTGEPLFDGGEVRCLSLKEIVSEKLRAAALRKTIAPRDFYDLDFILRNKFDLADPEILGLFQKKITEDGGDADLKKYCLNLGRSDLELNAMRARIETEFFDVLTPSEKKNFDLDAALQRINNALKGLK
jgi:predicted nucleotidyltransferase component of viral defense system